MNSEVNDNRWLKPLPEVRKKSSRAVDLVDLLSPAHLVGGGTSKKNDVFPNCYPKMERKRGNYIICRYVLVLQECMYEYRMPGS